VATGRKRRSPFLAEEMMLCAHWWNGGLEGVLEDWDVRHLPTIYVLDIQGVIRYKELHGEKLEKAVNSLLKEDRSSHGERR
jgi:hypothetical protein